MRFFQESQTTTPERQPVVNIVSQAELEKPLMQKTKPSVEAEKEMETKEADITSEKEAKPSTEETKDAPEGPPGGKIETTGRTEEEPMDTTATPVEQSKTTAKDEAKSTEVCMSQIIVLCTFNLVVEG